MGPLSRRKAPRWSTMPAGGLLFTLLAAALACALPVHAQNPTNQSECVRMTRDALKTQCHKMFGAAGQREQLSACLSAAGPELDKVCEQFFGAGSDFCATCTSSCVQSYPPGSAERPQCLTMCLDQPGCK